MDRDTVKRSVLLAATVFITGVFLWMIGPLLLTLLLAGIFSALARPVYLRLDRRFGGRHGLASIVTVLLVVSLVLIPLLFLLGIVTAQAIKVSESVTPWVQKYLSEPESFSRLVGELPFFDSIKPLLDIAVQKAGELISGGSKFLIGRLGSAAGATVNAIFQSFVLFYAMFFFLKDGDKLLGKIVHYLPLDRLDKERLLDRFTSVTRATLKGTLIIGLLQGVLSGLAFWAVGIPSAVFWGAVMTVLSIMPGIGTALIWAPAAVILAIEGSYGAAVGLALFSALVIGSIDNFLRPRLVGRDTKLHELMIFLGTIGGIILFGLAGFIIGPVVAALFVTTWDIYGVTFKDVLPESGPDPPGEEG